MSTMQVQVPDAILAEARQVAAADRVPFDNFVANAIARQIEEVRGLAYLRDHGRRGDRDKFLAVLDKAPPVPPDPGDEIEWASRMMTTDAPMNVIQVSLSDSTMAGVRSHADQENAPLDQMVATIVSRWVAAQADLAHLAERALRGRTVDIRAILALSPDVPPMPGDEFE